MKTYFVLDWIIEAQRLLKAVVAVDDALAQCVGKSGLPRELIADINKLLTPTPDKNIS